MEFHSGYTTCSSQSYKFNRLDYIMWTVQIKKFLIVETYPLLILIPLGPKYSPQDPVFQIHLTCVTEVLNGLKITSGRKIVVHKSKWANLVNRMTRDWLPQTYLKICPRGERNPGKSTKRLIENRNVDGTDQKCLVGDNDGIYKNNIK